ncbi:IclR family transcriptional regulator [Mesorhizobium sp. M2C.T.Ca.TU.002.02.1.1]|uniref:IclR family transcriptional regulator n=1 Tax=Mesorhizobium sp. M2C.T.Ca.TU.002.02.1.1 TaxID=2496788 RepID=UPI000FCAB807|nr:IclR family transcriptional regulator [Mesorhizobium sp. M2C.T.Ca.TU.002.02.1.1]RUU52478.1 IclR family transcriptional regulator [Mesorhizobium sp. M2C.T.Ca.TU.002.02.1.1]RUU66478.1 IclR family transcriptional regulator [Mesorhizobium sp. M2C.T.Ca.TU.009.01.2.1]
MRKRNKPIPAPSNEDQGQHSSALVRGLQILRAFTPADTSLGNQELIERTGLPKATISRLTYTLVGLGYLLYDPLLGRYSIGPATVSLGYSGLSSSAVVYMAKPLMQTLAFETGVAVAMGMRDGLEMVYVSNCRPETPVTLRLNVGSRLPIWQTSMGLAYLAAMEEGLQGRVISQLIENNPDSRDKIRRAIDGGLENYAKHGYVASFGDWYSYINAVGVPFRPSDGSQLVAITCGGIKDLAPVEACISVFVPKLKSLLAELQNRLTGATLPPMGEQIAAMVQRD